MKKLIAVLTAAVIAGFTASTAEALPTAVFEFKFDETGVGATNTGSAGTSSNLITDQWIYDGTANNDLHGAAGSGVTGQSTDRALDTSTMVGGVYPGGNDYCPNFRVNSPNVDNISGLHTATWSGWFNTSQAISTSQQIYLMSKGTWNSGFQIRTGTTADTLEVFLGGVTNYGSVSFDVSSVFEFTDNGIWEFWAVTYDGSLSSENVKLYWGTNSSSVVQVDDNKTLNCGTLVDTTSNPFGLNMNIGVDYVAGYSLTGFTDGARIFDSVLTAADLETLRSADAVPEPGTLLLVGTGVLGAIGFIRRRRMR